jgi:hypothetical protein
MMQNTNKLPALEPMVYVLVVSDFTLPLFEACLARIPSHVLLVVSDGGSFDSAAARLKKLLSEKFPSMVVVLLNAQRRQTPLKGDDVIECQNWIADALVPLLRSENYAHLRHVLNFTGGTKAMTAAMIANYAWSDLDYKSISNQCIQIYEAHTLNDDSYIFPFTEKEPIEIKPVAALDVARLYNEHAQEGRINALCHHESSADLAKRIWNAQQDNDQELNSLFAALEHAWQIPQNCRVGSVIVSWSTLPAHLNREKLKQWADALSEIAPEVTESAEGYFRVPGNEDKTKQAKAWIKWVSGVWLEQLAFNWLTEYGVPEQRIARNLIFGEDELRSAAGREADLFIHYRSRSLLVEIKAGIPPNGSPKEIEQQISSIKDRLGRSKKIILLGPSARKTLEYQGKFEDFELRCRASQVSLCLSRNQLIELLHKG